MKNYITMMPGITVIYKFMDDEWDMDRVIKDTVIIHFCGKKKPWKKNYSGRFHALYKHYEKMALWE